MALNASNHITVHADHIWSLQNHILVASFEITGNLSHFGGKFHDSLTYSWAECNFVFNRATNLSSCHSGKGRGKLTRWPFSGFSRMTGSDDDKKGYFENEAHRRSRMLNKQVEVSDQISLFDLQMFFPRTLRLTTAHAQWNCVREHVSFW